MQPEGLANAYPKVVQTICMQMPMFKLVHGPQGPQVKGFACMHPNSANPPKQNAGPKQHMVEHMVKHHSESRDTTST